MESHILNERNEKQEGILFMRGLLFASLLSIPLWALIIGIAFLIK